MDQPTRYPEKNLKQIGTRPIRPDGVPKVTGRAQYGADIKLPQMLYGRLKRSPDDADAFIISYHRVDAYLPTALVGDGDS